MPIYEYECEKCGYQFEELQKITEEPLKSCPKCKKDSLKKLMSNTSFQLKGTGWYVTDFKDKKPGDKKPSIASTPPPKKTENKPTEKPKNVEKK